MLIVYIYIYSWYYILIYYSIYIYINGNNKVIKNRIKYIDGKKDFKIMSLSVCINSFISYHLH